MLFLSGVLFLPACWDENTFEDRALPYDVTAIAMDPVNPNIVYLGTGDISRGELATGGNGIYKSTDGGATWRRVVNGLLDLTVNDLVVDLFDPNTVYAGTDGGIYRGIDTDPDPDEPGVESWERLIGSGTGITAIVIDRNSCGPGKGPGFQCKKIYAASESEGVRKSWDGGANWTLMNENLTEIAVKSLGISPPLYLPGTFPGSCPDPCNDIRDVPSRWPTTTLYAGTEEGHVFRFDNDAQSWFEDKPALSGIVTSEIITIATNPIAPNILYAGLKSEAGQLGVYRSMDPGTGWQKLDITASCQPQDSVYVLDFSLGDDQIFYLGSRGLCRSVNEAPFEPISTGLDRVILSLAIDPLTPTTMYAGSFNSRLFKTVDGGQTWGFIEIPL